MRSKSASNPTIRLQIGRSGPVVRGIPVNLKTRVVLAEPVVQENPEVPVIQAELEVPEVLVEPAILVATNNPLIPLQSSTERKYLWSTTPETANTT